ncbi:MAG: [protein-PII] uridylyltransferase, partial [Thioalkalispiraceae bacterium]
MTDREFDANFFDKAAFVQELNDNPTKLIPIFKQALKKAHSYLKDRFLEGRSATELVYLRAQVVDVILQQAWLRFFPDGDTNIALVAVGGYGRGELHPHSDIDIQILIRKDPAPFHDAIIGFTTFLWDIGLEVGHSVRTIKDCVREARQDITVATNILESRLLIGAEDLFEEQQKKTSVKKIWPSKKFFAAKLEEQQARHQKFNDTTYNLEPNLKEGPGGLRDIQMIGWVAKRHFNATTLHDLVTHDFLTDDEYKILNEGEAFLWQIRFAMHIITGRREDRLLIDHQRALAKQFGYQDDFKNMAVEKFMKEYYRTVMELNRLNEMLLNLFQEEILIGKSLRKPKPLNKRFQVRNNFLEVVNDKIFKYYPFALLEVFLLMEQNPKIKGVRANTIRLIRNNLQLIDNDFRDDLGCQTLFMEILRQPTGITHELRRMNRYGVLAAYLPIFGNIVGQMQHDLFHVYTVDEHTLMVIRNLRRFTVPEFKNEFPLCSDIIQTIPKQELLLLAGLFHDIAKGRGGSHAELGAKDAFTFCQRHQLSNYDSK